MNDKTQSAAARNDWVRACRPEPYRLAPAAITGLAAAILVTGCTTTSGPALQAATSRPGSAAQATGGLRAAGPAARADSACAVIPVAVISAVLPFTPHASGGRAPGYVPGTSCEYDAISAGYSLTVTLYLDMSRSAFSAADFQPRESGQWPRATVHIGDQSIAWKLPGYSIIAIREGHRVVVIGMFAAVRSPPDASWRDALKLAIGASVRHSAP